MFIPDNSIFPCGMDEFSTKVIDFDREPQRDIDSKKYKPIQNFIC